MNIIITIIFIAIYYIVYSSETYWGVPLIIVAQYFALKGINKNDRTATQRTDR